MQFYKKFIYIGKIKYKTKKGVENAFNFELPNSGRTKSPPSLNLSASIKSQRGLPPYFRVEEYLPKRIPLQYFYHIYSLCQPTEKQTFNDEFQNVCSKTFKYSWKDEYEFCLGFPWLRLRLSKNCNDPFLDGYLWNLLCIVRHWNGERHHSLGPIHENICRVLNRCIDRWNRRFTHTHISQFG